MKIINWIKLLLVVLLPVQLLALPPMGSTLNITGTTVGAPTAKFPLLGSTSGSCSLNPTAEPYRLYTITCDMSTTITINITNVIDAGGSTDDTGLFWYSGTFNPAAGCTNFSKICNDPMGSNLTFSATANTTYTFAVVGLFGTADDFALTLTAGTGNISSNTSPVFGTPSVTNVGCNGGSNGSVTVSATGGSGAISYSISPSVGTQSSTGTFSGLTAQTYTFTATDASGSTKTTTATVTQPTAIVFGTPSVTNVTCNGGSNGSVVVSATGGTGAISYSISPSVGTQSPSGTFNGLTAQTYTFTATDANGCTGTTTAVVTQPNPVVIISLVATDATCAGGNNGRIIGTAGGGSGSGTYSISPNIGTQSPSGTFNGLTAQTYTFTATDSKGCTKTATVTVGQPTAVVITPTITNARCFGGSSGAIAISVSGGTGSISYTISPNANTKSVTSPYTGLTASTYTFTATDGNGCVKTQTAVVTQPSQIVIATPIITNASCIGNSDGKIVTSASGGTGAITLGIYPSNGTQSPSGTFTGLTPISYMVIATDANNCEAEKFATVSAGVCNATVYSVAGSARTESNTIVNNVTVSAKVNTTVVAADDAINGSFNITMAPSNDVQIRPAKNNNDDAASGVTTFDITKVSRHFLDIERLESPYKLIAADVDKSGDIDAVDMLLMRRFILRVIPNLPGGNFRFIDKAYNFINPTNPFAEDFPEVVNFSTLNANNFANFVAVKLGDVNDSYNALSSRSARTLSFNAEEMSVVAGNEYTVSISANKLDVAAFQGTFSFNGATVKSIKGGNLNNLSNGNFGIFTNAVTTSWNGKAQDSVDVVAITFVANKSGKLSDLLTINSALTQAMANDVAGNEMNINLKFNTDKVVGGEFMLYQNQPNPVASKTTIGFNLPIESQASLTILTVDGKVVKVFNGQFKAGYNSITVDKSDVQTSGVFYYRLETADHRATKKMIIID